MEISVKFNKKSRNISVRETSLIGRGIGLMFKSRNTPNLLFSFNKDTRVRIHSLFVFFPFLALWLDDKNSVIKLAVIQPFRVKLPTAQSFRKIVEIPINKSNREIIDFFVGKGKI